MLLLQGDSPSFSARDLNRLSWTEPCEWTRFRSWAMFYRNSIWAVDSQTATWCRMQRVAGRFFWVLIVPWQETLNSAGIWAASFMLSFMLSSKIQWLIMMFPHKTYKTCHVHPWTWGITHVQTHPGTWVPVEFGNYQVFQVMWQGYLNSTPLFEAQDLLSVFHKFFQSCFFPYNII